MMRCPFCKEDDDRVLDSRIAENGCAIRRRRECNNCGRRYTTYERMERFPLRVVKRDGKREPYQREKLVSGFERACHKLPIPSEELEEAIGGVEREIFNNYETEVPSLVIGEMVMNALERLNNVAYIRFASVYREFRSAEDFIREAKKMVDEEKKGGER